MDRFQAMQVFMAVVDANSFSRAADNLNLPRATVSTTIQSLENHLKVRLLNRTTRSVSLTPDGASYYERCARILSELEDTESAFREVAQRPQGRLRVDVPTNVGRLLIPQLKDFRERYPDIELAIGMGNRPVDLVQEGVDCVIRAGELSDSSLVARRIGTLTFVSCAAPGYLALHGMPHTLEELQRHHTAVHYFSSRTGRVMDWDFMIDGVRTEVKVPGSISVNDTEAYLALALQGFGLVQALRFMARPYMATGELVEILPQYKPAPLPLSVVYPQSRHLSPKVRAFADWAAELCAACPILSGREDGLEGEIDAECRLGLKTAGVTVLDMLQQQNDGAESVL